MKLIPYEKKIAKIQYYKSLLLEYQKLNNLRQVSNVDIQQGAKIREQINMLMDETAGIIRGSGVSTSIYYSPPPAVGGLQGNLDLISNLFNLGNFQVSWTMVYDLLDRAVGNYRVMRKRFFVNLFNPFHWIGEIIRLPFRFLSFAGFNADKAEHSIVGKIYKFISSIVTLLWTLIELLNYFGIDLQHYIK